MKRTILKGAIYVFAVFDLVAVLILEIQRNTTPPERIRNTSESLARQVHNDDSLELTSLFPPDEELTQAVPVNLRLISKEVVRAGQGAKSVLMDKQGKYVYSFNLEAMTVTEYDRISRKKTRTLQFYGSQGKGYDYTERKWVDSFEEKPVEGCITHEGNYLWVSLHNGGGIIAWNLKAKDELQNVSKKKVKVLLADGSEEDTYVRFFTTGRTPKVLLESPDGRHLMVTNWHDNSVTVLDIHSPDVNRWALQQNIKTGSVPRGMAVAPQLNKLFVTNMGSGQITQIDLATFQRLGEWKVGRTPRHILTDQNFMYISLSSPDKLIKVRLDSMQTTQSIRTANDPRTIAFSGDSSLVFVTCYSSEKLQAFTTKGLNLLGSWDSPGKPVGVAVYQKGDILEAWVCNYTGGYLKVFTFEMEYGEAM
ncbi:hypothetical protein AAG747_09295 [Rapidithrix thailandica]|uniref:YncE family protein n=1 Tax=Rapidithrix thailandica TaxID=413964 RepID=A0AAW9S8M7_9BACT